MIEATKVETVQSPALSPENLELGTARPYQLALLREYLTDVDYSLSGLARLLELREPFLPIRRSAFCSLLYGARLAREPAPLASLFALFWLSHPLPKPQFRSAIPPELRDVLCDLGLVVESPSGCISPTVTLVELNSRYIVADKLYDNLDGRITSCPIERPVMPPHASTLDLLLAPRDVSGVDSLLDIGCGSGVLALAHAESYSTIEGIDVNSRAIGFSQLNAALNGIDHAHFRVADGFEPLSRRFDHLLFNTPSLLAYKGAEQNGTEFPADALGRFAETQLPSLLTPDGVCQLWLILPKPIAGRPGAEVIRQAWRGADRFHLEVRELPDSEFRVTADEVAGGSIRRDSYLLQDPEDAPALLAYLREHGIAEVAVAVVELRPQS